MGIDIIPFIPLDNRGSDCQYIGGEGNTPKEIWAFFSGVQSTPGQGEEWPTFPNGLIIAPQRSPCWWFVWDDIWMVDIMIDAGWIYVYVESAWGNSVFASGEQPNTIRRLDNLAEDPEYFFYYLGSVNLYY